MRFEDWVEKVLDVVGEPGTSGAYGGRPPGKGSSRRGGPNSSRGLLLSNEVGLGITIKVSVEIPHNESTDLNLRHRVYQDPPRKYHTVYPTAARA